MTTAAELREALQTLQLHLLTNRQLMLQAKNVLLVEAIKRTGDAARTIALPILEADPELVERLRAVLLAALAGRPWNADRIARQILAAISTPTPGVSE